MAVHEEKGYSFLLLFSLLLPTLLVCLLLPTIFLMRRPRLRLPPGPRSLPLLGNLHLLGSNPHQSLTNLSKRYGPLMFLRFGSVPVIVASSPTMARLILQTHDRIFCSRPKSIAATHVHDCKDVFFSQPDSYWKLARQICVTELFGSKRLEAFRPMVADEVRGMLRAIAEAPDKVHVRRRLYATMSNIISRMAVGKRLQDVATKLQADPSYNLTNLMLEGYGRDSKALSLKLHRVWQELIDERRSLQRQPDILQHQEIDFLDVLLSAAERDDAQLSDTNIMSILTDMYAAGIDTSTVSVEWALAELLTNPNILKKVQEELETVVGTSRLVQESDIHQLSYLQAVVKETMRLHPVVPLLLAHMANQECRLLEFDIPANAHVFVNVFSIGRDPTIWHNPLEFCPERFIDYNILSFYLLDQDVEVVQHGIWDLAMCI